MSCSSLCPGQWVPSYYADLCCVVVQDGGAVFLDSSSLVSVHRSVFSDGVADNGGAVGNLKYIRNFRVYSRYSNP